MKKKILVTSALPYVNNVPHLGTMVCIISADVYTRFLRLKKKDVISVLGTDEHGTTTEAIAMQMGMTPKQAVDHFFKIHKEVYDWFNCSFDCWGRTSSKDNVEITQEIFLKLHKNGYIIEKEQEQMYDEEAKKFLSDRFIEGTCPHCKYEGARGDQCEQCGKLLNPTELINPKSKLTGNKPVVKKTKHLFIRLDKLQPALEKFIKKKENAWSENARTTAHAWLKEGLKERAITRDLKWGISIPLKGFEDKVFYVWFDAPIGYIAITKSTRKDWKKWWHNPEEVELVQFMGKDNIPFHTILFPASLLGANDNYTLIDSLSVNEYLNYEDLKFSKSRGTGIFGDDVMKTGIPADVWRYYLMINRPEKNDTQFLWSDFQDKLNSELVGNLGNFINRTITFTNRFFNGTAPKLVKKEIDLSKNYKNVEKALDERELKKALKEVMNVSKSCNQFMQEKEPWKLVKEDKRKAGNIIANLLLLARDLAILVNPYLPETSKGILSQLNLSKISWQDLGTGLKEGHKIGEGKLLFNKLEDEEVEKFKIQFSGQQGEKELGFSRLNLKVAEIKEIKLHPDAEKLYIIQIDCGEKRQLVAGLKKYYKEKDLLGRKIIIVSNLEPAKLRGEKSEGMLLAVTENETVGLLFVKDAKPGTQVLVDGAKPNASRISFKEFLEVNLEVKNGKPTSDGLMLKAGNENVKVDKRVKKGKIS